MAGAFIPSRGVWRSYYRLRFQLEATLPAGSFSFKVPYVVYAPDSPVSVSPSHALSGPFSLVLSPSLMGGQHKALSQSHKRGRG